MLDEVKKRTLPHVTSQIVPTDPSTQPRLRGAITLVVQQHFGAPSVASVCSQFRVQSLLDVVALQIHFHVVGAELKPATLISAVIISKATNAVANASSS